VIVGSVLHRPIHDIPRLWRKDVASDVRGSEVINELLELSICTTILPGQPLSPSPSTQIPEIYNKINLDIYKPLEKS